MLFESCGRGEEKGRALASGGFFAYLDLTKLGWDQAGRWMRPKQGRDDKDIPIRWQEWTY